ncbi:uncharacterized protein MYCFIDRAFT_175396 [Pseudocercospora fijiensis CIRAD86]|uniref:Uncharacterized protein n=1 Tax=Pseudocercospora fijiensis (strain CIRAD86) TaxID=383855 RepID=M2YVT8_PSEFD|nr:uncharacterized protein MYCFIDRAFT_175396 [Pseudocercospora fijiensis CIRAD86]EME81805.1 hypothetical protein MYCFIDRAFT_175396 [Pseudocercospora fijiensis CIRAD86]
MSAIGLSSCRLSHARPFAPARIFQGLVATEIKTLALLPLVSITEITKLLVQFLTQHQRGGVVDRKKLKQITPEQGTNGAGNEIDDYAAPGWEFVLEKVPPPAYETTEEGTVDDEPDKDSQAGLEDEDEEGTLKGSGDELREESADASDVNEDGDTDDEGEGEGEDQAHFSRTSTQPNEVEYEGESYSGKAGRKARKLLEFKQITGSRISDYLDEALCPTYDEAYRKGEQKKELDWSIDLINGLTDLVFYEPSSAAVHLALWDRVQIAEVWYLGSVEAYASKLTGENSGAFKCLEKVESIPYVAEEQIEPHEWRMLNLGLGSVKAHLRQFRGVQRLGKGGEHTYLGSEEHVELYRMHLSLPATIQGLPNTWKNLLNTHVRDILNYTSVSTRTEGKWAGLPGASARAVLPEPQAPTERLKGDSHTVRL